MLKTGILEITTNVRTPTVHVGQDEKIICMSPVESYSPCLWLSDDIISKHDLTISNFNSISKIITLYQHTEHRSHTQRL